MICGSSGGTSELNHGNSTAWRLLVSIQWYMCTNRFYHSFGWCEACGHMSYADVDPSQLLNTDIVCIPGASIKDIICEIKTIAKKSVTSMTTSSCLVEATAAERRIAICKSWGIISQCLYSRPNLTVHGWSSAVSLPCVTLTIQFNSIQNLLLLYSVQ